MKFNKFSKKVTIYKIHYPKINRPKSNLNINNHNSRDNTLQI